MIRPLHFSSLVRFTQRFQDWLFHWTSCVGYIVATAAAVSAADGLAPIEAANRVTNQLAAGEFGAALETAANVAEPSQQLALFREIATAQRAAGEPVTATWKRTSRSVTADNNRDRPSYGGGGSMAGFQSLMQIIRQNTSSLWQGQDPEGGNITPETNGVRVDPHGLLHRLTRVEQHGSLASLGTLARKADLNADVARQSELRLMSLTRLEKAVAQRLSEGLPIPETMVQLAGLSQIKYVIVYPDSHDVVIGGPADAWEYNAQGLAVTCSTGRPTMQLDDLVTVLRTFARSDADFGCSINTRDAGVKALNDFVQQSLAKGPLNSTSVRHWAKQLQQKLGRQDIEIWGVPANSRVARVIVEADYRMKLIGIDDLKVGKEIPSYFDLLASSQTKKAQTMDALRWWLTMKYAALMHSADRTVFEIQGASVLCQSENQMMTADGKHLPTGQSEPANRQFAEHFTAAYDKLAARDSVFAELQNIFDLALVSALISHENLSGKADWDLGVFGLGGDYATASYAVPREVESVVNHRVYNGHDIVVQVAGGVRADLMSVVKDPALNRESPRLENVARSSMPVESTTTRWWWDAAR